MKKYFLFAAIATLMACNQKSSNSESTAVQDSVKSSQNFSLDTTKLSAGQVYYQCPMHHEVISDKAGICPKCEMELEPVTKS